MKLTFQRLLDMIRRRKQQYQLTFGSPAGQDVLIDLAKFCHASESCFDEDPRVHAAFEGRREVWLRIQQFLGLTAEQIAALHHGAHPINQGDQT